MIAATYPFQDVQFKPLEGGYQIICPKGAGGRSSGKGGGSEQQAPPDDPNTLRSKSIAKVMFALCEGEVQGPSGGDILRNIYLDKTPIRAPSGKLNFTGFIVDWRRGSASQTRIPGFGKVGTPGPQVGVTIRQDAADTVRTINDPNTEGVLLRFRVPSLREIAERGNVIGSAVRYQIYISNSAATGANPELRVDSTIEGKSTSPYERTHEVSLRGNPPWTITVRRITPDATDDRTFNEIIWQDVTLVSYTNSSYPGTALLAVQIDSEPFGSTFPTVHLNFNWRLVRVPHNYNAVTGQHDGVFNGASFKTAWTQNPIWIIFDLLTDTEVGIGLPDSFIDTFNFYEQAQYCAELIPGLNNELEPRWTFNAFLDQREIAFNVIEAIAASFNASIYWDGSKIRFSVDRPLPTTLMYSPSDVIVEKDEETGQETERPFRISKAPITNRPNYVNVTFSDQNNFSESNSIPFEDKESTDRYGLVPLDLTKYGCTRSSEAYRAGKWKILTNKFSTKVVEFRVGQEGVVAEVGAIAAIQAPYMAGRRLSGRIMEVNNDNIVIDDQISIVSSGTLPVLRTIGGDGKIQQNTIDITRGSTLNTDIVYIEGVFNVAPLVNTPWQIDLSDLISAPYKITSVVEEEDGTFLLSGVEYVDKFATIELDVPFQEFPTSVLPNPNAPPPAPTDLAVEESLHITTNSSGVKVRVDVTWGYPITIGISIDRFVVEYRGQADTAWQYAGDGFARSLSVFDIEPGDYVFRVTPISSFQRKGVPATLATTLLGLLAPPNDIRGFRFEFFRGLLLFRWERVEDLDVLIGGRIVIRHTPSQNVDVTSKATWGNTSILAILTGNSTEANLQGLDGTYLIKAYDSSGIQSVNAAAIEFTGERLITQNVVLTLTQAPLWAGLRNEIAYDAANGTIQLNPAPSGEIAAWSFTPTAGVNQILFTGEAANPLEVQLLDDQGNPIPNAEVTFRISSGGGDLSDADSVILGTTPIRQGSYAFAENPVDLGSDREVEIRTLVDTIAFSESNLWTDISQNWTEIDVLWTEYGIDQPIDDAFAIFEIRIREDDDPVTGAKPWSDWSEIKAGDYFARFFEFRINLQSSTLNHNVVCRRATVVIDMPDIVQSGNASISDTFSRITFPRAFYIVPSITVAIANPDVGQIPFINSPTTNRFGFDVRVAGGGTFPKTVSYIAKGY